MCRGLLISFRQDPEQVALDVDADDVVWGPALVLPVALIVSETVSNVLKSAFPQGRR